MLSSISTWVTIFLLVSATCSYPTFEELEDVLLPEGHEDVFDHNLDLSPEFDEDHETKFPTSYQSFNLESKHAIPIVFNKDDIHIADEGLQEGFDDDHDLGHLDIHGF